MDFEGWMVIAIIPLIRSTDVDTPKRGGRVDFYLFQTRVDLPTFLCAHTASLNLVDDWGLLGH